MKPAYIFRPNTLYLGDCLEVMQSFVDAGMQVDLIYLDPPFNSKRDYSMLFKQDKRGQDLDEQAQFLAFRDTWHWTPTAAMRVANLKNAIGNPAQKIILALDEMMPATPMLAYLSYMAERIFVMRQLLKDTGSLYLHCDPTANSYLRLILDAIFGGDNMRNEIVWRRSYVKGTRGETKTFGSITDTIYFYAASKKTSVGIPKTQPRQMPTFPHTDSHGQYRAVTPLYGDASLHKCAKFTWREHNPLHGWRVSFANLEQMYADDRIHFSNSNIPYRKQYVDEYEGVSVGNLWTDIPIAGGSERLGYPTQKPIALLERIIESSSNEGDLVLDPFCGCGTTAAASFKLKRKFLGIDISAYVLRQVCAARLQDAPGVEVHGLPTDMSSAADLAARDPFKFEEWAVSCLPGLRPNEKQTGDGGVDGQGIMLVKPVTDDKTERGLVIAQVKGGGFTPDAYRALLGKIASGDASVGLFITLKKQKITSSMSDSIMKAGDYTLPGGARKWQRMIFWSIEEYFAGQYPLLPELADPTSGKPMPRQIPLTEKTADK